MAICREEGYQYTVARGEGMGTLCLRNEYWNGRGVIGDIKLVVIRLDTSAERDAVNIRVLAIFLDPSAGLLVPHLVRLQGQDPALLVQEVGLILLRHLVTDARYILAVLGVRFEERGSEGLLKTIRLPLADGDTMVAVKVCFTGLIDASDFHSVFLGANSGSKCSVALTHVQ